MSLVMSESHQPWFFDNNPLDVFNMKKITRWANAIGHYDGDGFSDSDLNDYPESDYGGIGTYHPPPGLYLQVYQSMLSQ
jgi:hypothetical protein